MQNSPFHNPQADPLPDANDIEKEFHSSQMQSNDEYASGTISQARQSQLEADKNKLRNFIIGLLVIGLVVGGILSIGLVWTLNRFDLITPAAVEQQ